MRKKNASRDKRIQGFVAGLIAVGCALYAPNSFAFCRTSSCAGGVTGARCVPALPTDCGVELFWKNPCPGFSMQQDASSQVTLDVATNIFEAAFQTWSNADCGGGAHPGISAVNLGPVACHAHEYNKKAGNANIILFQDEAWPHSGAGSTLALTTVTYNIDTGEIYDADMELNSANVEFTTDDKLVKFDLASIAAHETGHFLGLSHSAEATATMYADYTPGNTGLRTLEADDVAGICAAYPPGSPVPANCDSSPRRGLESVCSPAPKPVDDDGSCSVATGSSRTSMSLSTAAFFAACGWLAKRRRNRTYT